MSRLTHLPLRLRAADTRRARPLPKLADPFYASQEWRNLVYSIIQERGKSCEKCGRKDCRIFADHIAELRDGGARLDPRNIALLCGACHSRKTASSRAERR